MNPSFRIIDPFLKHPSIRNIEELPQEMRALADEIASVEDQETAIRHAYDTLSQKFRGSRILTFLRVDRFFITNLVTLWNKRGFLHCNHMNYLLRTVLVASGTCKPDEIEARWTAIWLVSPHQYLSIRLRNGKTLAVDLWGKTYGIPFGQYAHGLRSGSMLASVR